MIWSFPRVDDAGREYGGEVSFKFSEMIAVEKMTKWVNGRLENGDHFETKEVIPDCCTITVGRDEFDVKANYDEVLAKFKEYNEMFA